MISIKGKERATIWFTPSVKAKIEEHYRADNCRSQSEFIEKAVEFYLGYLNTQNATAFLPGVIATVLNGALDNFGQRIGAQLYKVAIEQNMCNHLLAEDTDMDARDYQLLRGRRVREVQGTNGRISFKEVLDFQKTI